MILALVVAFAGGLGALLRYVADGLIQDRASGTFPFGTFVVNVSGSFVLGLLTGMALYHGFSDGLTSSTKTILGVGFCGGLTTWSSASWESVRLFASRDLKNAFAYTFSSLIIGIGLGGLGIAIMAVV